MTKEKKSTEKIKEKDREGNKKETEKGKKVQVFKKQEKKKAVFGYKVEWLVF